MVEYRQTLTTLSFAFVCVFVVILSITRRDLENKYNSGQSKKDFEANQESFFKGVHYLVSDNNKPEFEVEASELTHNSSKKKTIFFNPVGKSYTSNGEVVDFVASNGIIKELSNYLVLKGEVEITSKNSRAWSDTAEYFLRKDKVVSSGRVRTQSRSLNNGDKVIISGDKMTAWPQTEKSVFEGNVKGHIKRKRVYDEQINFKSEKLELSMVENTVKLYDNVSLKKENMLASSRKGEIFLDNFNKKLKYYVLYDDVKVVERVETERATFERKAFSEKLEGISSEEMVILTGYPKVYQLDDFIKGNKIILRENNEVVEVDDANYKRVLGKEGSGL